MHDPKMLILPVAAVAIGLAAQFLLPPRHSAESEKPHRVAAKEAHAPRKAAPAPPPVRATPKPPAPVWTALWALDRVLHTAYEETKEHAHHEGHEHEGHEGAGLRLLLPELNVAIQSVLAEPAPALQGGDKGWVTRRQQDLGSRAAFLSDFASISDEELFLKFEDIVVVVEIMMSAADETHVPVHGGRQTHGIPTTPEEIAAAAAHAAECPID